MAYNRCVFVGNLGRDAEMRHTADGTAVSTLNLAVNEKWRGKDGSMQERTEWVRVVVWAKQAESLQEYLVKGKQILVDGKMQTRKWTDRDGHDRYTTEIRADRIVLLGGGGKGRRAAEDEDQRYGDTEPDRTEPGRADTAAADQDFSDDDIPF